LATGSALELEGDLYGPAVNLASRIVSIAYPGTVVVSREVFEALDEDDDRFAFRQLRPHHLKHIGRVRLYRIRRAADPDDDGITLSRARERRAVRRAWIADRMAEKVADLAAEKAAMTIGGTTEKVVRRVVGGKQAVDPDEADPGDEPTSKTEVETGDIDGSAGAGRKPRRRASDRRGVEGGQGDRGASGPAGVEEDRKPRKRARDRDVGATTKGSSGDAGESGPRGKNRRRARGGEDVADSGQAGAQGGETDAAGKSPARARDRDASARGDLASSGADDTGGRRKGRSRD
jgi:hypothetical protein